MNCAEAEQFFDAYLDGELAGSLRLEFDAHRLRCQACQQKLAMIEACEHVLARDGLAPTPPPDFTARVMAQVATRELSRRRARRRRIVRGLAAATPVAAALVLALIWSGQWRQPADTGVDRAFAEKVQDLREAGDAPDLYELIIARIEERARAAGLNLRNIEEAPSALAGYARELWLPEVLSFSQTASPFELFPPGPPAEESDSASDEGGLYRL